MHRHRDILNMILRKLFRAIQCSFDIPTEGYSLENWYMSDINQGS